MAKARPAVASQTIERHTQGVMTSTNPFLEAQPSEQLTQVVEGNVRISETLRARQSQGACVDYPGFSRHAGWRSRDERGAF